MKNNQLSLLLIFPAFLISCAFFLLPVVQLIQVSLLDGGA
ncbi:ABC transporter permease, partial [Vibrio sp. FNV 38]|nr:ABC transporter permease [Vibrio sp. FNV 38]